MPYRVQTFDCLDCGASTSRRIRPHQGRRCIGCAIARSSDVNRQLANRDGPEYVRWAWATATAMRRIANGASRKATKRAA